MKVYSLKVVDEGCTPKRVILISKFAEKGKLNISLFEVTDIPLTETEGDHVNSNGCSGHYKFDEEEQNKFVKAVSGEKDFYQIAFCVILNGSFIDNFKDLNTYLFYKGSTEINLNKTRIYPATLFSQSTNYVTGGTSFSVTENTFAKTYNSKIPYYWFNDRGNNEVSILFPTSSTDLSDNSDLVISYLKKRVSRVELCGFGEGVEYIDIEKDPELEVDAREVYYEKLKEIIEGNIPTLKLSQVETTNSDGVEISVDCTFNGKPLQEEIFVVKNSGYVSKERIILDENGHGTFNFIPLGLSAGDKAEIKVGFKLFTGLDRLELTVV